PLMQEVFGQESKDPVRRVEDVMHYIQADNFRIAVLGEFKRGKSTLINALVGERDLMPSDTLPCTSALTEIRGGKRRTYERQVGGLLGDYEESTEPVFRSKAGDAARSHTL